MERFEPLPTPGTPETPHKNENVYLIPASILIAGIIIALAVVYTFSPGGGLLKGLGSNNVSSGNSEISMEELEDDDPVLGNTNASVTLVEFGDFQCPYCKRFHDEARRDILETYVETGKAKIVYRDFPLEVIHPAARPAAEAAECADDQGKFWPFHDALYTRQAEIQTIDYVKLAKELGLDAGSFESCLKARTHQNEVSQDYQDGVKAGVDGTPAIFVNGVKISGAQPFDVFKQEIEAALGN